MPRLHHSRPRRRGGFTLVELLVVMAILALLLSVAAPRYFDSLDRAKDAALKADLRSMRDAIDKFRGDTGQYPATLQQLVEGRYLRALPVDPVTERANTWIEVPHPDGRTGGVYDVRSGATGAARDGSPYASW